FAEILAYEEPRPGSRWLRLAILREDVDDHAGAEDAYAEAAAVGDDELAGAALWRHASMLADDGRQEAAIPLYEASAMRAPIARPAALLGLAEVLYRLGRDTKAQEAARNGLEVADDPTVQSALALVLGQILRRSERRDEAAEYLELAIDAELIGI